MDRHEGAECLLAEVQQPRWGEDLRTAVTKTVTPRPDWTVEVYTAKAALFHQFGVSTLAGFGFTDDHQPGLTAAGSLVLYLKETFKAELRHLRGIKPYRQDQVLLLDEVTRRSLELTRTLRDGGREGSLLSVLDRTVTPMGARLLQDWLLAPLADRAAIEARLDAVAELKDDHALRAELRAGLAETYDLQRLTARA